MLCGQYLDSKSRPHQIVWHIPDHVDPVKPENPRAVWGRQESSYHHYWRDEQGSWHRNLLPGPVGNRAKIFFDAEDNAYAIYMVNQTDDWWREAGNIGREEEAFAVNETYDLSFGDDGAGYFSGGGQGGSPFL